MKQKAQIQNKFITFFNLQQWAHLNMNKFWQNNANFWSLISTGMNLLIANSNYQSSFKYVDLLGAHLDYANFSDSKVYCLSSLALIKNMCTISMMWLMKQFTLIIRNFLMIKTLINYSLFKFLRWHIWSI